MSSPRLAIVLVHYHGATWLARAVAALRADLAGGGLAAELIVVDNGSTPDEARQIRELPVRCVDAGTNRGYAGGVNLGVAATEADFLFAMNPDVEVLPGCIGALIERLRGSVAAVGPHFYWDRERRLSLPPTEKRTRTHELLRALAPSGEFPARIARSLWRSHARKHWLSRGDLRSSSLSGALLGWRRETWDRVGPFDEGYRLYFEENDWLERVRATGLVSAYVRDAEAVHYFNQSARHAPQASTWFQESAARYDARYYGKLFLALRRRFVLAARGGSYRGRVSPAPLPATGLDLSALGVVGPAWIEVSPSPDGFPAAAERLETGRTALSGSCWELPDDVKAHVSPGDYRLRVVTDAGRELAEFAFRSGS